MTDRNDYLEELNSFRSSIAMNGNLNHSRTARDPKTLYEQFKRMDSHEISTPLSSATNGKQVVTKDESQMLRESVLKANRPRNPYFEVPPPSVSYTKTSSPPVISITKTSNNSKETTPRVVSEITEKKIRLADFCRPEPQFVQENSLDEIEDKTALELRELEELEADYQRLALRSHSSKEDFPSPSTYYFSDEGSSTENEKLDLQLTENYTAVQQKSSLVCHRCKNYIHDMILQAIGKNFHPHCFCCSDCGRCLDGLPFCVDSEDRVFCMEDYERLFIPTCARCNNPIKASNSYGQIVRVVAMDRGEYHISCYSCEGCGMQLTNEEHSRCFPIGDHLLCKSCHNRWQKLGGLSSPLTDL
ncbi:hypothetical protein M3Y98_00536100 [Aphelenchoides besseyi]|nr:hypothetical protein M3Y98_00536100 [Aphelenchoides besseyi]KAI6208088.1 hypothetical protein M3Y96_00077800 [Aphelenchoides besseyi]